MKHVVLFLLMLSVLGCVKHPEKRLDHHALELQKPDSSMRIHAAQGFKIDYFKAYKRLVLFNPWKKGEVLQTYYLVHDVHARIPEDGISIQIPLKSLVSGSSTHHTFLEQLRVLESVVGVCDVKRTYNPKIRMLVKDGRIADLGDPFKIQVENCLMLKPDVLMINSYNQQDENIERLKLAGIRVLYNNEWMEPSLLGRAEWIRMIAALYDKESLANDLFDQVEKRYFGLKAMVEQNAKHRPTVLSGDDFRGTWYLPGGKSFTAQLFQDAGAAYFLKNDTTIGSLPMTFEQVLHDFYQAEVWIGVSSAQNLRDLLKMDERYALFKAYKNKAVWAYTLKTTPEGGNDFWETAVARPDWLLSDFIKIFHPELNLPEPWHFMKKLD